MNANELMQLLNTLGACTEAKQWAKGKSWQEVYDTCHRGDWLLWLYRRSKCCDFKKLTLAKGLCANTVRHMMKDERSLKAVDAAIAFGKGEISREKLNAAAYAAYAASYAATYAAAASAASADAYAADAASADAYAADADSAAAYAADADSAAAYAADADSADADSAAAYAADADSADAAADAAADSAADADSAASYASDAYAAYAASADDSAIKENQQKTADIVREVLPFEIWEF